MGIPSLMKKRLRLYFYRELPDVYECGNPLADEEAIGRRLETGGSRLETWNPGASPRGNPLLDYARARLACWVLLGVSLTWHLTPGTCAFESLR